MDGPREKRAKLLAACSAGDQQALENLFQQYDIKNRQPSNPYCIDRTIPEEEWVTTTYDMLRAAVSNEDIDMVNLLYDRFGLSGFEYFLIVPAIDTRNTKLVETLCKRDPGVANSEDENHFTNFQYACKPENSEIVKLLLKYGADPNMRSGGLLNTNAYSAVAGGMPLSVLEMCFDRGYCLYDGEQGIVNFAVANKRLDLVELFFRRGKKIPAARFPPQEELIEIARENEDLDMEKLINKEYPRNRAHPGEKKSLFQRIVTLLRLQS